MEKQPTAALFAGRGIWCIINKKGGRTMQAYPVGTWVETKKQHPCGSKEWKVIRAGADYKIQCAGCGRIVMLPYEELKKRVKRVIEHE